MASRLQPICFFATVLIVIDLLQTSYRLLFFFVTELLLLIDFLPDFEACFSCRAGCSLLAKQMLHLHLCLHVLMMSVPMSA
jgi:hypothetical protein